MKILIFRTGQLGDTLVSLPAVRSVQRKYPSASLTLLTANHLGKQYVVPEELLEGTHLFTSYLTYPVADRRADWLRVASAFFVLVRRLRRERFDLVVHLEHGFKNKQQLRRDRLFFRLAGVPSQVTTLEYRHPVSRNKPLRAVENEVDFFLRALEMQGFPKVDDPVAAINLRLGAIEQSEIERWLGISGRVQLPKRRLVGVAVGSKMQSKRWPIDRYKAVLEFLIEKYSIVPVFLGGLEDQERANDLIVDLGKGLNACGALSLRASARMLQECVFYLGNDTGTMHLAVAAGIPCVALFSARDIPGKWYPYGKGHFVHRLSVDCEGCMLCECYAQKRKCLTGISIDSVCRSCESILLEKGSCDS